MLKCGLVTAENRMELSARRWHRLSVLGAVGCVVGLVLCSTAASARDRPSFWKLAQAGSAGGSVTNQNKSVSGREERAAPHQHAVAPTRTKGHQHTNETGSSAAYDGAWVGASFGECIVNGWRWNAQIGGGIISGANVNGRVSGGGGVRGAMIAFGVTYDFRGQLKSNQGSGTWVVRSGAKAGCAGTWTIVRS